MKSYPLSVNKPVLLLVALMLAVVVAGAFADTRGRDVSAEIFFRRLGNPGETYGDEVQQICVDRDGYAWLATTERLLRFDGSRVRPYGEDLRGACLAVDTAGRLYASAPHQAYVYDRLSDCFTPLPGIRRVQADAGRLWFFSAGSRSAVCGSDTITLPVGPVVATVGRGAANEAWLIDSVGRLWHAVAARPPRLVDSIPLTSIRAASLYADMHGNVWYWDAFSPGLHCVGPDGVRSDHLDGNTARALVQDSDGKFWIASDHSGLLCATAGMKLRPVATTGLPSNHTSAITIDSRRRLWVGAPWGAALARPGRLGIRRHRILPQQDISAVRPARDGLLWLGVDGGGLILLDPADDKEAARITSDSGDNPGDRITGMIPCGDDTVLILTYGNGAWLHHADVSATASSGVFTRLPGSPSHIRAAVRTPRAGHIWVASHMSGIYGFDPKRPDVAPVNLRAAGSGLRTDYMNDITVTPEDTLYAATGYGVYRFHTSDPRPVPVPGALATIAARAIAADIRSDIWIGTHSGLYRFRPATGVLNAIPALSGQCINKISVDNRGHVWVLSPTAVHRVIPAPDSRTAVTTYALGEEIPAINVTSMTVTPERIYLGGNGKFVELIPPSPTVLPDAPARILLPDYPPGADEIYVSAGNSSIRVATTALTQTPPPILYRLNPDRQWQTVPGGSEPMIPLDSLSPGTYPLQIRLATDPLAPVREITLHVTGAGTGVSALLLIIAAVLLTALVILSIVIMRRRSRRQGALSDSAVAAPVAKAVYHTVESTPVNPESQDRRFLERAREIVETSMSDPDFGVDTFARQMCVSRSGLYKRLTALTGLSPLEYIRRMRLSRGRELLRARAGTVAEVSFAVGMAPRQFSKLYRQQYGLLPSKDIPSATPQTTQDSSDTGNS